MNDDVTAYVLGEVDRLATSTRGLGGWLRREVKRHLGEADDAGCTACNHVTDWDGRACPWLRRLAAALGAEAAAPAGFAEALALHQPVPLWKWTWAGWDRPTEWRSTPPPGGAEQPDVVVCTTCTGLTSQGVPHSLHPCATYTALTVQDGADHEAGTDYDCPRPPSAGAATPHAEGEPRLAQGEAVLVVQGGIEDRPDAFQRAVDAGASHVVFLPDGADWLRQRLLQAPPAPMSAPAQGASE